VSSEPRGKQKEAELPAMPAPESVFPDKFSKNYFSIKNVRKRFKQPFIFEATLGEKKARILVDTGADIDCVSERFVKRHNLPTENHVHPSNLKSYEGEVVGELKKQSTLFISTNEGSLGTNTFGVVRCDVDAILGVPWIRKNRIQIDYDTNELLVQGLRIPFQTKEATLPNISQVSADKFWKSALKEKFVFAVSVYEILNEGSVPVQPGLEELLSQFEDIFSDKAVPDLPRSRGSDDHTIPTIPDARPIARNPYRLSPEEREVLKQRLKELIEAGHIRASSSAWGSPVLFVRKKDGSLRMCIDYRQLNKYTVRNNYPLPRIEEMFDALQGAKFFTTLDLNMAYHQIRIAEGDIPKTAFSCSEGHYEFLVMTFGLTNAPASFQGLMNKVFRHQLGKSVVVYLDDIMVYSKTWEDHLVHIREVLEILRTEQFIVKRKKCVFGARELSYLGHVISENGLRTDPAKIKAVADWPAPGSAKEVREFLGLTNYYQKFVRHYANIAAPLNDLLRKGKEWKWGQVEVDAFTQLKEALQKAPVLKLADPARPYRVETDASNFAIGAVLSQQWEGEWLPVTFISRKLKDAERNYNVYDRELLAFVHALRKWRCYLLGLQVDAFTDHHTLTKILDQKELTGRQARWSELLAEYHISISYRKGAQNIVADALSRRADHVRGVEEVSKEWAELCKGYEGDLDFGKIVDIKNPNRYDLPSHADKHFPDYRLEKGVLYKAGKICVPLSYREKVLREAHDSPSGGHPGGRRTYLAI